MYYKSGSNKHCITYLKTLVVIVNIRPRGFFDCPVQLGNIQVIKNFIKCLTKCSSWPCIKSSFKLQRICYWWTQKLRKKTSGNFSSVENLSYYFPVKDNYPLLNMLLRTIRCKKIMKIILQILVLLRKTFILIDVLLPHDL